MAEAQQEPVTLVSPSGQTYISDDPREINTLISSYGYTRRSQDTAAGGATSRKRAPKPSTPEPTAAPEVPAESPGDTTQ